VIEYLDTRVLGAIRFVDALLGTPVSGALVVTAPAGVRVIRNNSGLYVITDAPGFAAFVAAFDAPPPTTPATASVTVTLTVTDPTGRYLPRRASIAVPLDATPANSALPSSIFLPQDRVLFPSPTAVVRPGAAAIRLSVKRAGSNDGLPYAYVRISRTSDSSLLARGMADARGEVFVGVPGIPVTTWSATASTPVTTSSVAVTVVAYYDATAFDPTTNTYPDPDALDAGFASLPHSATVALDLASGAAVTQRIDVPVS
jgi:hypothetical protein